VVDQLATEADPIKGRVLIVLPDHDRLRPFVQQLQTARLKRPVTGSALDFFIDEVHQNLRELSDSIVKNSAFQTIAVEERNDVMNLPTTGSDFVIAYQIRTILPNNTGAWTGAWIVRRAGSAQTQGASIDPGTPVGAPRLASFVKSVREAALRLGGKSVGGATATTLPATTGGPTGTTSGSGIIVDKQGGILTNAHVVTACADPRITDDNKSHYQARIVVTDQANDLALLKAEHRWPQAATFRDGGEPKLGATAIVAGFPLTGIVASSLSVTAGTVSATAGLRDDSRMFQISAPVQPGNSGGPVLDSEGHVSGLVTAELNGTLLAIVAGVSPQNVNFAIKAAIMRNFLAAQDVDYAHASGGSELTTTAISAQARRFTVRIECGAPPATR
jgi:S1-C subfamily serine protease